MLSILSINTRALAGELIIIGAEPEHEGNVSDNTTGSNAANGLVMIQDLSSDGAGNNNGRDLNRVPSKVNNRLSSDVEKRSPIEPQARSALPKRISENTGAQESRHETTNAENNLEPPQDQTFVWISPFTRKAPTLNTPDQTVQPLFTTPRSADTPPLGGSEPYLPERRRVPSGPGPGVQPQPNDAGGSPPSKELVEEQKRKIILAGIRTARRMEAAGDSGACAKGVQLAFSESGLPEALGTGDGWGMRHYFFGDSRWQVTTNPNEATAFVRAWTPEVVASYGNRYQGRNLGHVGILYHQTTKDGYDQLIEVSDVEQVHDPNNPRYEQTIYFKYVG